jgi:hypothetical protein
VKRREFITLLGGTAAWPLAAGARHLDPSSIDFFRMQIEACDANLTYVEQYLDEVGGAELS